MAESKAVSIVACLALATAGCASVPDVTVAYQPTTWGVGVSVVQTITCTRDGQQAIVARSAVFTPVYKADSLAKPLTLRLKKLDRFFADSELAVGFTDDGRLKSINQSTTGQGETITKQVVGATIALGTLGTGMSIAAVPGISRAMRKQEQLFSLQNGELRLEAPKPVTPSKLCEVVDTWTSSDKAKGELPRIAVVRSASFGPDKLPKGSIAMEAADPQSKEIIAALDVVGFDTKASLDYSLPDDGKVSGAQPILDPKFDHGELPLTLQQTSTLTLTAFRMVGDKPEKIQSGRIDVPLPDTFVKLPIPLPALFGKQSFQLQLGDSGRITSFGYGRTSGTAGAFSAVSSIAGEQSALDAAQAASIKAAADQIAQQNRLNNCLLATDKCQ